MGGLGPLRSGWSHCLWAPPQLDCKPAIVSVLLIMSSTGRLMTRGPNDAVERYGMSYNEPDQGATPGLGAELKEGILDGLLGTLWTYLHIGGMILAWIAPVVGLVLGGLFLWRAFSAGLSTFLPIVVIVVAVIAWIVLNRDRVDRAEGGSRPASPALRLVLRMKGRVARGRPRLLLTTVLLAALTATAGCGSSTFSLTGVWRADDGTGLKTVNADGSCSGMYYNNGKPLDIGGGMTCTLGDKEDDGTFLLVVRQPPNQLSYRVRFSGPDTAQLLSKSGEIVVTLTRQ